MVEEAAVQANLVLSDWHIFELVDHADRNRVIQAASWLESLPHVWLICDRDRVTTFEAAQCLAESGNEFAP